MSEAQDEDLADEVVPTAKQLRKVVKMKIRNFIDGVQLRKDMSYSLVDLSNAMAEQASHFVHYAGLAASASRQVDDVSMLLEITEAKVYRKLRDDAAKKGEKVTEAQLEKLVNVHPQVVAMKRGKNEAKQIEANAKAAVEGFRQRRDMLIQEGASQREERKGELSINARNERETGAEASIRRIQERMQAASSK